MTATLAERPMTRFEYAPAPESREIARLKSSYQIFVDGQFRDGGGDGLFAIVKKAPARIFERFDVGFRKSRAAQADYI